MTVTPLEVLLVAEPTADEVKPGWVALLIVLAMGVALALLMRSMVKQFRKVDFEEEPERPDEDGSAGSEQTREQNGSSPG